jgi:Nuclease-related domain
MGVNVHLPQLRRSPPSTGRAPGQYTRALVRRMRMRALLTLGLFAVFTVLVGRVFGFDHVVFEVAEIALLCVCFAVTRYVLPVVERYDRGAKGEEYVGAILDELRSDGWLVIHDAELQHSNVDHIVLGPAGLFTIETKSNPGPISVQRLHGRLIRQVQLQRERVEALIGEPVEPLLVYSRARVDRPGRRRKGIRVLEADMLPGFLEEHPRALNDARIAELRARLLTTFDVQPGRLRRPRADRLAPASRAS